MKKLIIFDTDGVLVKERSCWIAVHKGLGKEIVRKCSKLRREYFRSPKMSYESWAKKDIKLWGDVGVRKIKEILDKIPLMKGAKETSKILKRKGYLLGIISTGINILIERVKRELNFDFAIYNEIYEKEGRLAVKINVSLDKNPKDKILKKIIKDLKIEKKNIIAIGDSDDDYPMMKLAGFSILFNPDPTKSNLVKKLKNTVIIKSKNLRDILLYLKVNYYRST